MSNIIDFEEAKRRLDVQRLEESNKKKEETPKDTLLNGLNRELRAKFTGALRKDEFAKEEILAGDIYANGLKNNKVAGKPESFKSFIPETNIFKFPHEGLERAAKTVKQSVDAAIVNAKFLDDAEEDTKSTGFGKSKVLTMDDAA